MKARSDRFSRKYSSFMEMKADWDKGKDFAIDFLYPPCKTGRYINKDDVLIYSPNATVEMLYSGANGVLHGGTIQ